MVKSEEIKLTTEEFYILVMEHLHGLARDKVERRKRQLNSAIEDESKAYKALTAARDAFVRRAV